MPTMNVSLTEEIADFVEGEVASGDYVSASEVVREALRIMKDNPKLTGSRGEALRCLLYLFERGEALPLMGAG